MRVFTFVNHCGFSNSNTLFASFPLFALPISMYIKYECNTNTNKSSKRMKKNEINFYLSSNYHRILHHVIFISIIIVMETHRREMKSHFSKCSNLIDVGVSRPSHNHMILVQMKTNDTQTPSHAQHNENKETLNVEVRAGTCSNKRRL